MKAGVINSLWNGLEKLVIAIVSFVAFTVEAKNLGPSLFGELSVALSYISLLFPFLDAGQFNLALINLAKKVSITELASKVLSARILLLPVYLLLLFYFGLEFIHDTRIKYIYFVLGTVHVFKIFDVTEIYFLVQSKSGKPASIKASSQIFGGIIRCLSFNGLIWNFRMSSFGYLAAFIPIGIWNVKRLFRSGLYWKLEKTWLKNSLLWFLAAISSVLYSRLDLFMVSNLLSSGETGVFAFSQRISEFFVFIPIAIIASVYPTLLKSPIESIEFHKFFRLVFYISLMTVFAVFMGSNLILIAVGTEYKESLILIRVLIWNIMFTSFAYLRSKWFVDYDLHRYGLYTVLIGLTVNCVLNWILIPVYGALGAATATLLSRTIPILIFLAIPEVKPIITEYFKAAIFFSKK